MNAQSCRWPDCENDTDCMNGCKPAPVSRACMPDSIEDMTPAELRHIARKLTTYAGFYTGDKEAQKMAARCTEIAGMLDAAIAAGWTRNKSGLLKAMEIVGNMRQSEAGLIDAKHSGQRGCDRSDALHDAYQAIKAEVKRS